MRLPWLVALVMLVALPFAIAAVTPADMLFSAVAEDGIVEWIGSIAWALASLAFLYTLLSRGDSARALHGFWVGSLALICFLAAGEEISWGQRIFNYETPPTIAESNLQGEMNLHNLSFLDGRVTRDGSVKKEGLAAWLTFSRMGKLIWMGFLIALPIGYRWLNPVRRIVDRLRLPVPPLLVAAAGIVSYVSSRILFRSSSALSTDDALIRISADEINETVIAILFLTTAIVVARRTLVARRTRA